MFGLSINFSDPSKDSYYYPIIIIITIIIIIIHLLIEIIKVFKDEPNENLAIDNKILGNDENNENGSFDYLIPEKGKYLKYRYLIIYIVTKSAIWAKTPYLYILYSNHYKMSSNDIINIYLINGVSSLIVGPITGLLADKSGRKKYCLYYNVAMLLNIYSRIEGTKEYAYIAEIFEAFGSGIISTTFEAWLISESERVFGGYRKEAENFRKKIFRDANIYDGVLSIIISCISNLIYINWGINAPFLLSSILNCLSYLLIHFLWDENESYIEKGSKYFDIIKQALREFKKLDVTYVGLIEGIAMACLNIYLFSWTHILKQTNPGGINITFIFIIMILSMILGTKIYEILIIYMKPNYYISISICLLLQGIFMYLIYIIDSFLFTMIFFALFNGLSGFYNPLNSLIKSNILIEIYRAFLMNLYRVPFNIYIIIILMTLKMMNPLTIVIINGTMCFIAFFIGIFLVKYNYYIEEKRKEDNEVLPIEFF